MSSREHWDAVYASKGPDRVSWFRPHLERSLAFLEAAKIDKAAGIIDIGGGASTLVTPWGKEQEFVYCYCRLPG
jgi:hypothetical protein